MVRHVCDMSHRRRGFQGKCRDMSRHFYSFILGRCPRECRDILIRGKAREHSNARISRQQGGHCRWQVAAGGDRMWPTCAMRWCWARFGGAHRESSPAMPPLQLPAWSRSRAVLKCVHSFQSLQAIPDEKCHLRVGERKL